MTASKDNSKTVGSALVWLRKDLRLDDQPALQAARETGLPVIPVFIWAPEEEGAWPPGGASQWWLHHSLDALDGALKEIGSRLILRAGPSLETLRSLIKETGAKAVFWTRRYEPFAILRDKRVKTALKEDGLEVGSFNGALLYEPWEIETKQGKPYQVYSPFWRRCMEQAPPSEPLLAPKGMKALRAPKQWPKSVPLTKLGLLPKLDWADGFSAYWTPGEAGAHTHLKRFMKEAMGRYADHRNLPDVYGTSRLSPHLTWGEISPRRVWYEVNRHHLERTGADGRRGRGEHKYLKEIGWREFGYHLLYHFPHTPEEPLRDKYKAFPWEQDLEGLRAWQQGQTGYPLVDAGMRELWTRGWMHNRVRMVVASFLVKDLRISWFEGARWFWDTLVDADLANNTLGWQWAGGCGADAAPYFRIFNPVSQSEKFDPKATYIRRFVPELEALDSSQIHAPWNCNPMELELAGVKLGVAYPPPMVDHKEARAAALEAFQMVKGS